MIKCEECDGAGWVLHLDVDEYPLGEKSVCTRA